VTLESKTLLLGIGAQKAGTTWLADYLSSHPDVYIPPLKELHYFDHRYGPEFIPHDQLIARCEQRIEKLHQMNEEMGGRSPELTMRLEFATDRLAMFRARMSYIDFFHKRVGEQKVFAEITPGYQLLDARVYRMMNEVHPEVRFVFIMRDPIDRSWSHYRMARRRQTEIAASRDFSRVMSRPQIMMRSDYRRTIEELEKAVPKERVKYLFFEDLFTPEAVKDITGFLRIQDWPANYDSKSNVGAPADLEPDVAKLAYDQFRFVYEYVAERFADRLPQRWRDAMETYN